MKRLCAVGLAVLAFQTLSAAPPPKPVVGDTITSITSPGLNFPLCDETDANCDPTLASITIPVAGNYAVTAKLNIDGWASTIETITTCILDVTPNAFPPADTTKVTTAGHQEYYAAAALQTAYSFTTSQVVYLKCAHNNGANGQTSAQNWKIMATRIASLSGQ